MEPRCGYCQDEGTLWGAHATIPDGIERIPCPVCRTRDFRLYSRARGQSVKDDQLEKLREEYGNPPEYVESR